MPTPERSAVADYKNPARLDGCGFVVLGAGQGIGRQSAHALAQSGAKVLCVDREIDLAKAVAEEVRGEPIQADVTTRAGAEAAFDKARALFGDSLAGVVDIVGIADVRKLADIDDAAWDRNFDMVLRHAYLAVQIGSRSMPRGGTMVFVSSLAASRGVENQVAYGVAKAGLDQLVRSAATELGPRNIRINAVAPGFVRTPRLLAALNESFWTSLNDYIPLGRAAEPSDIAKAILFFASDMSTCVTGTVLPIDGGVANVADLPSIPLGPGAARKAS
jgi:NAD(P)-dependent dehydrogenase (short-subunit alcohol dehydrogenase family)